MELARPHPECPVVRVGSIIRGEVGPGSSENVLECYRSFVVVLIQQKAHRALLLGRANADPLWHLAARDAVIALHVIGIPAGFRLALVPFTYETLNGFKHAEIEACQRGLRVQLFRDEQEAMQWLSEAERH
jgi:hypothetical protein